MDHVASEPSSPTMHAKHHERIPSGAISETSQSLREKNNDFRINQKVRCAVGGKLGRYQDPDAATGVLELRSMWVTDLSVLSPLVLATDLLLLLGREVVRDVEGLADLLR